MREISKKYEMCKESNEELYKKSSKELNTKSNKKSNKELIEKVLKTMRIQQIGMIKISLIKY